jgi:hypothetical protein
MANGNGRANPSDNGQSGGSMNAATTADSSTNLYAEDAEVTTDASVPDWTNRTNTNTRTSNGNGRTGNSTSNGHSRASSGTSGRQSRAGTENGRGRDRMCRINVLGLALAQYPDYSIVVTGHSLGAGTATILTFLLR